eukprot:11688098-Alexandrium_andersonii.AAC.1
MAVFGRGRGVASSLLRASLQARHDALVSWDGLLQVLLALLLRGLLSPIGCLLLRVLAHLRLLLRVAAAAVANAARCHAGLVGGVGSAL